MRATKSLLFCSVANWRLNIIGGINGIGLYLLAKLLARIRKHIRAGYLEIHQPCRRNALLAPTDYRRRFDVEEACGCSRTAKFGDHSAGERVAFLVHA